MNTLKVLEILDLVRYIGNPVDGSDFPGIEAEIPEIDEGFDGLALYYGADTVEKMEAVQPTRALPAIFPEAGDGNSEMLARLQDVYAGVFPGELPAPFGAYPYAVHGDEFGFDWSASHAAD